MLSKWKKFEDYSKYFWEEISPIVKKILGIFPVKLPGFSRFSPDSRFARYPIFWNSENHAEIVKFLQNLKIPKNCGNHTKIIKNQSLNFKILQLFSQKFPNFFQNNLTHKTFNNCLQPRLFIQSTDFPSINTKKKRNRIYSQFSKTANIKVPRNYGIHIFRSWMKSVLVCPHRNSWHSLKLGEVTLAKNFHFILKVVRRVHWGWSWQKETTTDNKAIPGSEKSSFSLGTHCGISTTSWKLYLAIKSQNRDVYVNSRVHNSLSLPD